VAGRRVAAAFLALPRAGLTGSVWSFGLLVSTLPYLGLVLASFALDSRSAIWGGGIALVLGESVGTAAALLGWPGATTWRLLATAPASTVFVLPLGLLLGGWFGRRVGGEPARWKTRRSGVAAAAALAGGTVVVGTTLVGSGFQPASVPFAVWAFLPYGLLLLAARVVRDPWALGGAGAATLAAEVGIRAAPRRRRIARAPPAAAVRRGGHGRVCSSSRAMNRTLDVLTSFGASIARLGAGSVVAHVGARPPEALRLYEYEACPFCRKVREALSILDLLTIIYPCPKRGTRFRDEMRRLGGKTQFPYLVDPNTGQAMFESDDIVRYLFATYGDGSVPPLLRLGLVTDASSMIASGWRYGRGTAARPSRAPVELLELWSFEASPFCRLVREELSELELPYRLHNVAKGSGRRAAFVARSGVMQVPWLVDPNTGTAKFESADIVRYLDTTYAL